MLRSLVHPRKRAARANFFPHTVTALTINKRTQEESARTGYADLPCAYKPALLNETPAMMESEAATYDQVLLNGYYPDIRPKSIVMLTVGTPVKRLVVMDNLTVGFEAEQTVLLVTPDK